MVGVRDDAGVRRLMLDLPGNPGAVLIGLHVHVAAMLAQLHAVRDPAPQWRAGRLAAAVRADARDQLLRMRLRIDADGQIWLERSEEHTSELQSLMRHSYAV